MWRAFLNWLRYRPRPENEFDPWSIALMVLLAQPQDTKPHTATLHWVQGAPQVVGDCPVTSNNIYRSTVTNQEVFLVSIPAATTYADKTVLAGNTYFYKVTALNCGGESPMSNEVKATIPHKPGP